MRKIIKQIYSDKISGWTMTANVILFFISLLTILIFYHLLPSYIPLYNKRVWGYTRLGNTVEIFFPLFLLVCCVSINTLLGVRMQQKSPLLARFLFATSLGVSLFTTFFIIKIVSEIV